MKNRRGHNLLRPAVFALALLQAGAALAETWYQWVDSQGTAHLHSHSPGAGIAYQPVAVPESIHWAARPDIPAPVTDASSRLVANEFAQAPDSVYPVVLGASGLPETPATVSGSAVAISENMLLTNCLVTESGGRDLLIGVGGIDKLVTAELVGRDYPMGQCVLSVRGARLHPTAGVRRFDTLELGEPVYAIGNSATRSLFRGELSGLQVFDGARYLLTTVPISSTSSGSGLFDGHGNLIGIISWIWWDSESVQVVIPAEDFWR
jgi:S1-C subfamily serine protease